MIDRGGKVVMKHKKWLLAIVCSGLLAGCGAGQSAGQSQGQSGLDTNVSSSGVSDKVSSKVVQSSQSEINSVNSLQQSLSKGESDLQLNQ
jgi:TolA-binding protein